MSVSAGYIDADSFNVLGDQTSVFHQGRRIKANCGVDGNKYGTIDSSTISGPHTTVNLLASVSDSLTANLTEVWYGIIGKGDDQSMPIHTHVPSAAAMGGGISSLYYNDEARVSTGTVGISFGSNLEGAVTHGGSALYVTNTLEGENVALRSLQTGGGYVTMAKCDPDGEVTLYHDGYKVFETFSDAGNNQGGIVIYSDSGSSKAYFYVDDDVSDAYIYSSNVSGKVIIQGQDSGGTPHKMGVFDPDGSVELYHDGIKVIETHASVGSNNGGLKFFSDTGNTTGYLVADDDNSAFVLYNETTSGLVELTSMDSGSSYTRLFRGDPDGSVELYHDGNIAFSTYVNDPAGGIRFFRPDGEDGYLYINGSDNLILFNDTDGGNVIIYGSQAADGTVSTLFQGDPDGATELYYNDLKALQTEEFGISIFDTDGQLSVLQFKSSADALLATIYSGGTDFVIRNDITSGDIYIQSYDSEDDLNTIFLGNPDAGVTLYYNGLISMQTGAAGINVYDTDGSIPYIYFRNSSSNILGSLFVSGDDFFINTGINSSDERILLRSYNGASYEVLVNAQGGSGVYLCHHASYIAFTNATGWLPYVDDTYDLGSGTYHWNDIYATNDTIKTSDERKKESIDDLPYGLNLINQLRPITYKFKDYDYTIEKVTYDATSNEEIIIKENKRKTHSRKHIGFSAQEIKTTLDNLNISTNDFAAYVHDQKTDTYGLRMGELVPILVKAIQELSTALDNINNRVDIISKN